MTSWRDHIWATGVALGSRGLSVALIAFAGQWTPGGWPLLTTARSVFASWDGQWYLAVAAHGYHSVPLHGPGQDFSFFPTWPLLIRAASLGVLPLEPVAVFLANGLFVLALVLVYAVLRGMVPSGTARRATVLFAFAPPAYVASLAYSEPLFLVLAAGAFLALTRAPATGAALTALAQLTRLVGSAISIAALARAWSRPGRSTLMVVATGPATFAAWFVLVAFLTSDPFGYLRGSPSWYRTLGPTGLASIWDGLQEPNPIPLIAVIFTGVVLLGTVGLIRGHLDMAAYSAVCVLPAILLGQWPSMPRLAWIAFPAFVPIARRATGWRFTALLVLFLVGQILLVSGSLRLGVMPP